MKLATAQQIKEVDRQAIEERGIDSLLLMERAAGFLVQEAENAPVRGVGLRAAVFCGSGNNGGDGTCAAGMLLRRGWQVRVFFTGSREKMSADHRQMERRLEEAGGRLEPFCLDEQSERWLQGADVIIDAIFGVGLNASVRGLAWQAIECINRLPGTVIAADLPSGIGADSGEKMGAAVRADVTVTFSLAKIGHMLGNGSVCTGRLRVCDIGIPRDLLEALPCQTVVTSPPCLPARWPLAHKGNFGKLYLLCGSVGYTGAPVLAAQGATRAGAGLVYVGVPQRVYPIVAGGLLEPMPHPLPDDEEGRLSREAWPQMQQRLSACRCVLAGPGLGRSAQIRELIARLLELPQTLVLDADALWALTQMLPKLRQRSALTVLTPHDGEFARLLGRPVGADRLGEARRFATQYGVVLVLKGHHTITAFPDGRAYINPTGNPGMAKGGSGDVLAGVLTALLAQELPAEQAAPWAVWLHGRAGDLCRQELGEYAMNPGDLLQALPRAFVEAAEPPLL